MLPTAKKSLDPGRNSLPSANLHDGFGGTIGLGGIKAPPISAVVSPDVPQTSTPQVGVKLLKLSWKLCPWVVPLQTSTLHALAPPAVVRSASTPSAAASAITLTNDFPLI